MQMPVRALLTTCFKKHHAYSLFTTAVKNTLVIPPWGCNDNPKDVACRLEAVRHVCN